MTTQQQTERDEALIADKKRLADELERMYNGAWADDAVTLRHAAALLRGDEPAKPDRYVVAAREFLAAWGERVLAVDQGEYDGDKRFQAAAAVLRKHFEPSAEVIEVARLIRRQNCSYMKSDTLADHILKGDQ